MGLFKALFGEKWPHTEDRDVLRTLTPSGELPKRGDVITLENTRELIRDEIETAASKDVPMSRLEKEILALLLRRSEGVTKVNTLAWAYGTHQTFRTRFHGVELDLSLELSTARYLKYERYILRVGGTEVAPSSEENLRKLYEAASDAYGRGRKARELLKEAEAVDLHAAGLGTLVASANR